MDLDGSPVDTVARDPLTRCPLSPAPGLDMGLRAYVTLADEDKVAVLDLSDPLRMDIARCVDVNPNADWVDEPFDVVVAENGRWYVTLPHGFGFTFGQLWEFEAGAAMSPRSLNLVGEPDHVALSPDGETLYVTALQNLDRPLGPYTEPGQFIVIDRPSWSITAQYPLGLAAAGLDVAADGRVVIASAGTDELYIFDPRTAEFSSVAVGPDPTGGSPTYQPFYVALTGETQAWVTNLRSGDLRLVDLSTGELLAVVELGLEAAPRDVVRLPDYGLVAVADTGQDEVVLVDEVTRTIKARIAVGPPTVSAGAPYGLAPVPGTPYLLVAGSRDPLLAVEPGAVSLIDVEEETVVRSIGVGRGPRLIAVAP